MLSQSPRLKTDNPSGVTFETWQLRDRNNITVFPLALATAFLVLLLPLLSMSPSLHQRQPIISQREISPGVLFTLRNYYLGGEVMYYKLQGVSYFETDLIQYG